ncbi:Transcriptional activator spt7 [Emydomyces testavorans]|uniref:SAGA complex subunit Spt7 n=1 Tax=Emydomyces testavorans TaxID=2070801 RepID=A0AAF0DC98_9EURO|nr:Transcriptional activator spt7 [Emydomyces testavorans]
MSLNQHYAWLPPGHLRPPDNQHNALISANGLSNGPSRPRTPQITSRTNAESSQGGNAISDIDIVPEEDQRIVAFRESYKRTEAKISLLFSDKKLLDVSVSELNQAPAQDSEPVGIEGVAAPVPSRRPARKLDEDDYDEYDEDEDNEPSPQAPPSPKSKSTPPSAGIKVSPSSPPKPSRTPSSENQKDTKKDSLEEIRKKLEQDKKETEEAAKRSFRAMFYTLENDRDAMLDQQRLEESERQVEAEMRGQGGNDSSAPNGQPGYGSLSSANLGASSLTLKNLIARIDMKRSEVQASDAELRSLMSEVRKNRSKWASEDKIGQEELYEAAEKVLSELKAMTEHSSAFLTRVNKRDAPDYYSIIKRPMDLGTMTKKLKALQYKSKQEFVDDLNLIWSNCLKYNTNPEHFLRKHALYMRKETEKLVPLIPDIVIRDRAEVEAEERRLQLAELDGGEESDDEPIMSSRGRKATATKGKKGATTGRKAPAKGLQAAASDVKNQQSDAVSTSQDSTIEGMSGTLSTPPPGTLTPLTSNGQGVAATGSQMDAMDIDGFGLSAPAYNSALSGLGLEFEDPEYKIWKQATKKDRALVAAERHRLFKGDRLNPDEPALLRTKAGMRRWLKNQREASNEVDKQVDTNSQMKEPETTGETFAENIEEEKDQMLPDYYDLMSALPDLPEHLQWNEDSEGNVIENSEEFLRILPKGLFVAPPSKFSKKMDANMKQMQETRKVCSKISIVKQMQQQSQMYQNQFQKHQPEPLVEQDVLPHVMNDEGPVISPWVCRAALQRSVAKVLYHTGFEEYQPSALDAVTDIAADFFFKIGATLKGYMESPKIAKSEQVSTVSANQQQWKQPYTPEQMILHTLQSVGTDVETLESYVKDDAERHGAKLGVIHERLKAHLTELLRPAFNDTSGDGSSAFNDGSEQFIGGDFAEDIDEDFFGFKELGLDKEFGLSTLSVPLHLLQNRMYNAHQAQNLNSSQVASALFPTPPLYQRISIQTLPQHIGLVHNFFLAKLHANNDEPLVEDLELPPKQRPNASRPRVPASGKIPPLASHAVTTSPQKRPAPPSSGIAAIKSGLAEPNKKKAKKNPGAALGIPGTDGADDANATGSTSTMKVPTASKLNGIKGSDTTTGQNGDPNGVDGSHDPGDAPNNNTTSKYDNMDIDDDNAANGALETASTKPPTSSVNGHV